jgi:hypothetical protein
MFASFLVLGLFAGSVSAATVYTYNNFGQSGDLYINYGNWIGDRTPDDDDTVTNLIGVTFEASETGTLAGITAAMFGPSSGYTSQSSFNLSLYADNNGVEGAQVWSQDYSFDDIYCCYDSGNGVTDFSISNGQGVTLNANQTYWLVAETELDVIGSFSWYAVNTGVKGGFHMGRYNEETGVYLSDHLTNSSSRAFSVSVSQVPLPAAFWLFGSTLVGMGFIRRAKIAA